MTELSRSEFDEAPGFIHLKGQTRSGEQIAVKVTDDNFTVYYHDTNSGDKTTLTFDSAWADVFRDGGTLVFFDRYKLKGLREIKDEDELKMEVEKRFSNMKEEFPKLYSEVLPVAKLFQKTGEIIIPSPLDKNRQPSMDGKTLYPIKI